MEQNDEDPPVDNKSYFHDHKSNLHNIEEDNDTLEPYVIQDQHVIEDDDQSLSYWADQFQISIDDLKAAIVMNGNAVSDIKKYLSV